MTEQKTTSVLGLKLDRSLDLKTVGMFVTVIISASASYFGIKNEIERSDTDRKAIHDQIASIIQDRQNTKDTVFKLLQSQAETNAAQNNRMDNFGDRVKQLLDMQAETQRNLAAQQSLQSAMHEDLALLKFALRQDGHILPGPRSDDERPKR